MDTDTHKLFTKLHREIYSVAKSGMVYRYKKYAGYCQILASSENEELRKVYETGTSPLCLAETISYGH